MNIAIIEDSKTVAHVLLTTLRSYGYHTDCFNSRDLAEQRFSPLNFQFLIVNTSLSQVKSKDLIREIREDSKEVYVLGLQTRGDWKSKVHFLNAGADDVISYPFPLQEIMARIQAILRRPKDSSYSPIEIKNVKIDPAKRVVIKNDRELKLRKREYSLLEYMARNKNRAISRSELLDHVWDYRRITESNTVDVHISNLRRSIGDNSEIIKTIHGFGYQLCDGNESYYQRFDEGELKEILSLK